METAVIAARVMVVEDDAIVARDLAQSLEGLGYEVVGVLPEADDVVDSAREARPDVVLMDIRLPGELNGIEAASELAEQLDIPVVFVTAVSDPGTLQRANASGSWGYMVKPFDSGGLRAAVEVAIHRHSHLSLLRESEARYWATLEVITSAVLATDDRGLITFANAAAEFLLGRPVDEMLGRTAANLVRLVDEGGARIPDPVSGALREGGTVPLSGRIAVEQASGRQHPVRGSVAVMRGLKRQISGAVLVLDDVIAEREAERQLRSRVEAMDGLASGVSRAAADLVAVIGDRAVALEERGGLDADVTAALAAIRAAAGELANALERLEEVHSRGSAMA